MTRTPDAFGNVHCKVDHRGYVVFRNPGRYVGCHRRPEKEVAPTWWWDRPLRWLAKLAGENV